MLLTSFASYRVGKVFGWMIAEAMAFESQWWRPALAEYRIDRRRRNWVFSRSRRREYSGGQSFEIARR